MGFQPEKTSIWATGSYSDSRSQTSRLANAPVSNLSSYSTGSAKRSRSWCFIAYHRRSNASCPHTNVGSGPVAVQLMQYGPTDGLQHVPRDTKNDSTSLELTSPVLLIPSTATTASPNTGTPQGDSLSPVLFAVYLEAALRDLASQLDSPHDLLADMIVYADDADFICNHADIATLIETQVPAILAKWSLQMNTTKTDHTSVHRSPTAYSTRTSRAKHESRRNTRKLGSLLGDTEDLSRRKNLATAALHRMWKIWLRPSKTSEATRLRLYNSYVLPILLYSSGNWALTQTDLLGLESFHRQQLRKVIGVTYPNRIPNDKLYDSTGTEPLRYHLLRNRWRLLVTSFAAHQGSQPIASWTLISDPANTAHGKADDESRFLWYSTPTSRLFPQDTDFKGPPTWQVQDRLPCCPDRDGYTQQRRPDQEQDPKQQQDPTQRQRQKDLTEPFREQAPTAKTSSGCHLTGAGTYKSTNIASGSFIVVDSLTVLAAMTLDLSAAKAGQPAGTTTFDTFKGEGPLVLASGSDLSVTGSGSLDGPCSLIIDNGAVNGIAKNRDGFELTKYDRKIYNEDDCMAMQPSTNTFFANNCSCGDHGISIGSLGVDDTGLPVVIEGMQGYALTNDGYN
ncbi:unnamed protein product [Phytophthora fragariaefolia]|uniref:Unnamed protein product n=1 Tax=Phytophthora fragariaefolia TaxID=1490495 RepID=A0A9W7CUI9_9STRA|nr:unnamed protein product [Phytophthora fragariaefolia]